MRFSDLSKLLNKVINVEFLNGLKVTTMLNSIDKDPDDGKYYANTGSLIVFVMEIVSPPPKMEVRIVQTIPYGIPEIMPQKSYSICLEHMLLAAEAPPGIANQYSQMTGGLIRAPAGVETQLPSMDDLAASMSKLTGKV